MQTNALAWILFYIAAAVVGIFFALLYLVSKKSEKKARTS